MPIIPIIGPSGRGLPAAQRMPVMPADTSVYIAGNAALQNTGEQALSIIGHMEYAHDQLEATSLKTAAALDMERIADLIKQAPLRKREGATGVGESGFESVEESYVPRSLTYMEDLQKGYQDIYDRYSKLPSNDRVLKMTQQGLLNMGKTSLIAGEKYARELKNSEDQAMIERNVDRMGRAITALPADDFARAKQYIDSTGKIIDMGAVANIWGSPEKAEKYKRIALEGLYHQYGTKWATTDPISFMVQDVRGENPLSKEISAEKYAELRGRAVASQKELETMIDKDRDRVSNNIKGSLVAQLETGHSVRDKLVNPDGTRTDLAMTMKADHVDHVLSLQRQLENDAKNRTEKSDMGLFYQIRGDIAEGKYTSVPQLVRAIEDRPISPQDGKTMINELVAYMDKQSALKLSASHRSQDKAEESRNRELSRTITSLGDILNPQGQMLGKVYEEGLAVISGMARVEMSQIAERDKSRPVSDIFNEVLTKYVEKTTRDLPAMNDKGFDGVKLPYRTMEELKGAQPPVSKPQYDQLAPMLRFLDGLRAAQSATKPGPKDGSDKAKQAGGASKPPRPGDEK